jgi:starvation-inducible DNA-binding protein
MTFAFTTPRRFNRRTGETEMPKETANQAKKGGEAVHERLTDLNSEAVIDITAELRRLLADTFVLYLKTKNFHWHMSGQHFRDYHLLLDEHSDQIFAVTDEIAERARKIGGTTLRSIGDISRHQRLKDNDEERVAPKEMLAELASDNRALTRYFRSAHETCEKYNDVATASLIEVSIDQTERRSWFLSEIAQGL